MPNKIDSLFYSVTSLPKIGDKNAKFLSNLGIYYVIDLLFHLPSNVIDIKFLPDIKKIATGERVICKAKIEGFDEKPSRKIVRRKPFKIYCSTTTGYLELVYFNYYPEYLIRNLKIGETRYISGKLDKFSGNAQISHPEYILPLDRESELPKNDIIYPATLGLVPKQIGKYIQSAIQIIPEIDEWISEELLNKNNWQSFSTSIKSIHNPKNISDIHPNSKARERLAYDEFLAHQLAINLMRFYKTKLSCRVFSFQGNLAKQVIEKLGFVLTNGQKDALADIAADQQANKKMIRLIQGDVGSGKTLVALCAMLNVKEAGDIQSCLMAPTDVLANQHYNWITKTLQNSDIKIALLTGKITGKKRIKILNELKAGEIDIFIGTHAIFQENVEFNDLGLIIIDEQHRFGVEQRASLSKKGNNADILVMTATPIPRTLTLALYGDMELTRILDKPTGRLPIQTSMMNISKLPEIVNSLKDKMIQDNRIYWVCPLIEGIEEQEFLEANNAAAEKRYEEFRKIFGNIVGMVHGKMKSADKENSIKSFADGETKLLVATTVIEVGIDVPEANIIIIEQAEKFGLSQLHQLRGRVGRGSKQSYCILLYSNELTQTGLKRLKALKSTNDGFKLADEDLKLRGSGNIVGTRQSGFPDFKIADFFENQSLLMQANKDAKEIVTSDPKLVSPRGENLKVLLKLFNFKSDNLRQ